MNTPSPLKRRTVPLDPSAGLDKITLLDRHQVVERLGIGYSKLDAWVRSGRFPKPLRLSDSMYKWRLIDVVFWIQREAKQNRPRPALRGKAAMWGQPKPKRVRIRIYDYGFAGTEIGD